jgi:hypothetical protein
VALRAAVTEKRSSVGDIVKWQNGDGTWMKGKLLATKGNGDHSTAHVEIIGHGSHKPTIWTPLVGIRPV